jgi:hypothetical protein
MVGRRILTALVAVMLTVTALGSLSVRAADAENQSHAWFNSNWSSVKTVSIDNTANPSALTAYQVKLIVNQQIGMRPDFADIRFTDEDGVTLLPYWLELANPTTAIFWIKVPSIMANSIKTIFMYYGNPVAASLSDGNAVFDFFDDFSGAAVDLTKWQGNTAGFTVSGGTLHGGNTNNLIQSTTTHTNPVAIETRTLATTLATNGQTTLGFYVNTVDNIGILEHWDPTPPGARYWYCNANWVGPWSYNFFAWHNAKISIDGAGNGQLYVVNDLGETTSQTFTNTVSNERISLGMRYDALMFGQPYDQQWDWIFARKYTSPSPKAAVVDHQQPQWYNRHWDYRKAVTIDNTANPVTLTGFQVSITTPKLTGMKPDYSDIRFTDSDGITMLPHWLEWKDAATVIFWVRVTSIPAGSFKTIYMYFGNPSARSLSDGFATFEFFDDFALQDNAKFTYGLPYGGYNPINYNVAGGQLGVWSDGSWRVLKMLRTFAPSENIAVGTRFMTSGTSTWHQNYLVQDSSPNNNRFGIYDNGGGARSYRVQYVLNGGYNAGPIITTIQTNTWFKDETIKRSPSNFDARMYTDERAPLGSYSYYHPIWTGLTWTWVTWQNVNTNVYYDWIYIRKVVETVSSAVESVHVHKYYVEPSAEATPLGNSLAMNLILIAIAVIFIALLRRRGKKESRNN